MYFDTLELDQRAAKRKPVFHVLILFMLLMFTGCADPGKWNIETLPSRLQEEAREALDLWGEEESELGLNAILSIPTIPGETRGLAISVTRPWESPAVIIGVSIPSGAPPWIIVVDRKQIDEERGGCSDRGVWVIAHEIGHYRGHGHSRKGSELMHRGVPCGGNFP